MEIINVLRDDRRNFTRPVERGERAVTASRSSRRKCRLHGKAPTPRLIARVRAGDEFIKGDRTVASPQSAWRSEIRNAAFGRDAGAGKGHYVRRLGDHVAEFLQPAAKVRCNHARSSGSLSCPHYSTAARVITSRRNRRHAHPEQFTPPLRPAP